MKKLILIFSFFFINQITSLTVTKLNGFEDLVELVTLDSDGNIYVVGQSSGLSHIYKFSTAKELLWKVNLPSNVLLVVHMEITSKNDLYLFLVDFHQNGRFAILRDNATIIQDVEPITNDFFYLDGNDNLFYTTKNGVRTFRLNDNDSVPIKNLENIKVTDNSKILVDDSGNIYTGAENYMAVITQESLQTEAPSAILFQVSGSWNDSVEHLIFDGNDNLWVSLVDNEHHGGFLKKFENGSFETIIKDTFRRRLVAAKDNVFVITSNFPNRGNTSDIYYVTKENEIIEISELKNITLDYFLSKGIADSDGNVYFYTDEQFSPILGTMIVVRPDEMKPVPIEFGFSNGAVFFVDLDFDEDLWVGTFDEGLHYVKKGEVVPEKVEIPGCEIYIGVFQAVLVNSLEKEIYVGCRDGLYVVVKS